MSVTHTSMLFIIGVVIVIFIFNIIIDQNENCPKCGKQMLDYDWKMSFCEDDDCGYAIRNGVVVGKWAEKNLGGNNENRI